MRQLQFTMTSLLMLASAAPVIGQDGTEPASNRTPVNAQRVLAALPPTGFAYVKDSNLENKQLVTYLLESDVTSPDVCLTQVAGKNYKVEVLVNGTWTPQNVPLGASGSMKIDWSVVDAVKAWTWAAKYRFEIEIKSSRDKVHRYRSLIYANAETRDRALAAAQYLQQACDKLKDMGF